MREGDCEGDRHLEKGTHIKRKRERGLDGEEEGASE